MGVFDRFNEEEAEVARLRAEVERLTREYEEATGKRPPIVSCKGDPAWHIAVVQERDALRAELAEANKARGELYDLQAKAVDALERAEAERDAALRERDEARAEGRRIVEETRLFRLAAGDESAALAARLREQEDVIAQLVLAIGGKATIHREALLLEWRLESSRDEEGNMVLRAALAASGPKEEA